MCFPLSLRNVEYLLHERGVDAGHETVWIRWCWFGPKFASEIRKRRFEGVRSGRWRWRLDEMHLKINGDMRDLWRAVDHIGEAPDCIVAKTWKRKAVLK